MSEEENVEESVDDTESKAPDNTDNAGAGKSEDVSSEDGVKADDTIVASGDDDSSSEEQPTDAWPSDWREKAAEHYAAGDKKLYQKEIKRLSRVKDPQDVWGMYRELESKFTSGTLIKKPGKDATEEDIKAYHKAIGVPDDPEEYLNDYDPPAGSIMENSDAEVLGDMVGILHQTGASKEAVHSIMDWYFEAQAAKLDEVITQDDNFRAEAARELKEELGPAYKRTVNSIGLLFQTAAGGATLENDNSVMSRLLGGRTTDGVKIGDDPDVIRWLATLNAEINPLTTVVDSTENAARSANERIAEIEKYMREDRKGYSKDEPVQAEYRRLLEARQRAEARA